MAKKKQEDSNNTAKVVTAEVAFGSILKERRLALGYTQSDLEVISEIGRSYISELESAGKQVCIRSIIRLAFALDTNPGELMAQVVERMDKNVVRTMRPGKKG